MSMEPSPAEKLEQVLKHSLHDHWRAFLIEGIVLVVLGAAAILVPPLATLAVAIFLGWIFLIGGVVGLVSTLSMRQAPGFWWSLLSALVALAAGLVLVAAPASGAVSLTLVAIAFFIIEGVATILFALDHRRALSGRWGWMMLSGIVDLFLAAIILLGLPGTAAWAIGLLVGINMVFGGTALIGMALHARRALD
ncbi:MAG TPA: HdeD family acid-resistance protein [Alphaproteobacteria bacterium]|nr:HdeD family acid-resistance protein [Alphaproteobacteria bacterium]